MSTNQIWPEVEDEWCPEFEEDPDDSFLWAPEYLSDDEAVAHAEEEYLEYLDSMRFEDDE